MKSMMEMKDIFSDTLVQLRHWEQSVLCFQEILSFPYSYCSKNSYMTSPLDKCKLLQNSGNADRTSKTLSQHIQQG